MNLKIGIDNAAVWVRSHACASHGMVSIARQFQPGIIRLPKFRTPREWTDSKSIQKVIDDLCVDLNCSMLSLRNAPIYDGPWHAQCVELGRESDPTIRCRRLFR